MKKEERFLSIDDPGLSRLKLYLLEMLKELQSAIVESIEDKTAAIDRFSKLKILIQLDDHVNAFANQEKNHIKFTIGILKAMTRDEIKFVMGHELYHIFYTEHGLRVEENLADLHSVKWLMASGTAPQAGISFMRKGAEIFKYTPKGQDFYGMLKDTHSPFELRIQHMQTYLASINQFGEIEKLSEKNQAIPAEIEKELVEALKKNPPPQKTPKIHLTTLDSARQELENAAKNFNHEDFCKKLRTIKVKQSDPEAMTLLEELVQISYQKFSREPETFVEIYKWLNQVIYDHEGYSLGIFDLVPMGVFKQHAQLITAFSEAVDLKEKLKHAIAINSLVKKLEAIHEALFRQFIRVFINAPKLWHDEKQHNKVILEDSSHQIALAYWNLGIYDKESVLSVMLSNHRDRVHHSANEMLYQYFAFTPNNTITIGRMSSEEDEEYVRIKEKILLPRLIQEEIQIIEKNRVEFAQAVKTADFRSDQGFRGFYSQFSNALHMYKYREHKYVEGNVQNSDNAAIDCIVDTLQEMLDTGNEADRKNIKGFYNNICHLITEHNFDFCTHNSLIPSQTHYARFLVSNANTLGIKWVFDKLFGDISVFSLQNAAPNFSKISGVPEVFSLADFKRVIEFYKSHKIEVEKFPDSILQALLENVSMSHSAQHQKISISGPNSGETPLGLWLLHFLNKNISIKNFPCVDVKHELLKERIHWDISRNDLNLNHYNNIPLEEFIQIFIMYDKTFSFPDIATRDFFGDVLTNRLEKLDLKTRMAWLDVLVVKNSLSDLMLRKRMITLIVLGIKESIHTHKVNQTQTVDQFSTYLIDKVSRRDLIMILEELTSVLQSQMDECQLISKKLKRKQIEDNPQNHAKLSGGEALVRFVTEDESIRLEFIKFLLDPVTGASADHIASVFLKSPHKESLRKLIETLTYLGGRNIWKELSSDVTRTSKFISEQYQQTLLKSILYDFHIQYHDFPMEVKAVLMSYILIPGNKLLTEKDNREAFRNAMSFVIDRLLLASHYTDAQRSFLKIFIDTAPAHTRELLLSGILAASHANNKLQGPARLGELIAFYCENRGPAETKIAQAIHSSPNTPLDIKKDLAHVKSRIKMPHRWEFSDRIMALPPTVRADISFIGHRLGSASYNIALEIIYRGQKAVLLLPRENAVKMAAHSFEHLDNAFRLWGENSTAFRRKISQTLREIIRQTSAALVHETNYTMSVFQENIATHLYDDTEVTIDDQVVQFNTMKKIIYDQDFRILEQAPGLHFNDLQPGSTVRTTVAKAVALVEASNLLRGNRIDSDRHGAQMRVQQKNNNTITVGLFDFAEVITDPPSLQDVSQFEKAIPYMMGDLMRSTFPEMPTFQQFVAKTGTENLSHYVTRSYRSLLALQDYLQDLGISDILNVVRHALMMPDLNPHLRDSLSSSLTQLKRNYFGQNIFSPLLEIGYAHWVANTQSEMQLTRALVLNPLPERTFSKYARGHAHFFGRQPTSTITFSMDALPEPHYHTGEPTWKIGVEITFENKTSIYGTAKFYGTPMLCRSEDASRLNLIEAKGPFQDFVRGYNASNIQDICRVLPPSNNEIFFHDIRSGAALGIFRGAGKITEWAYASKTSKTIAFCAGKTFYYSCYFAYEVSQQMYQRPENLYDWTTPVVTATLRTAGLAAVDAGFALVSNVCGWVSNKTCETAPRVSSTFKFFKHHVSKLALPYQVYQQGLSSTLANIGANMATNEIVCHVGNKAGIKTTAKP